MVKGIGTDIIELERISSAFTEHGEAFLSRLFTPAERDYFSTFKDPIPHIAGRFAAKEAIAKALGTGFGKHLSWLDIEILPDASGKPIATLSGHTLLVSISHCKTHATATALHL